MQGNYKIDWRYKEWVLGMTSRLCRIDPLKSCVHLKLLLELRVCEYSPLLQLSIQETRINLLLLWPQLPLDTQRMGKCHHQHCCRKPHICLSMFAIETAKRVQENALCFISAFIILDMLLLFAELILIQNSKSKRNVLSLSSCPTI